MRRGVFLRIGYFNENLGPGRSGISEPVKFAQHVIRSGGRSGDHRQPGLSGDLAKQLASELFRMGHAAFARGNINCAYGQGHTLAQPPEEGCSFDLPKSSDAVDNGNFLKATRAKHGFPEHALWTFLSYGIVHG